jgi:hypothetical protein
VISFDHTQTHTTVSRTPLDEGSARRRDLYLTTQTLYKTNIHASGGIRTLDPSKRSAADLHLRPRGHWDRRELKICFPEVEYLPCIFGTGLSSRGSVRRQCNIQIT